MEMFRLTTVEMTLANVNVRAEKHGDQDKLAADVKLEGQFKNDIIEEFAPGLLGVRDGCLRTTSFAM